MSRALLPALLFTVVAVPLAAQTTAVAEAASSAWTAEQQIAAAVLPLPETMRDGAAVFGWKGKSLVPLRAGTNAMLCLAEDPARKNFHVVCYHRDLDPFMAAGRARTALGLTREAVDSARHADIAAKKWAMPSHPTLLYEIFAPEGAYDVTSGKLTGGTPVFVIYTPYATDGALGASLAGLGGGTPWMMYPGEPWAHLMITP